MTPASCLMPRPLTPGEIFITNYQLSTEQVFVASGDFPFRFPRDPLAARAPRGDIQDRWV